MNPSNPTNPADPAHRSNPVNPSSPPTRSHEASRVEHGEDEVRGRGAVEKDDGLRRLLTWTFIALGVTLVLAAIGVSLAVYWFDPAHP